MSEPRLLIWLSDFGGGGAQRTMLNLAAALPDQGLAVELVVGRAEGPAKSWADPKLAYAELGGRRLAAIVPSLSGVIRSHAPDAVLSTMVDANVAAFFANRLAGNRAALVLRETNSHRARADIGFVRRRLARLAYRGADQIVALSRGVGSELVADMALDPARTVTIPNPVEVAVLARKAQAARQPPPPGCFNSGSRHVVAIGRLHRQKGFDILIDALARQDHDVRLIIIGEGPDRAALEAQVRQLGLSDRVHMPGFIDNPAPYLAHADLFVLSSRWEGFGHVIVEAMASGLPVVAADCPYGPADILRHGETGWLVPPEDAGALAAAIRLLLNDRDRAQSLAAAGAIAAERYQTSRVAGEYAAAIKRAIASKRLARGSSLSGLAKF